MVRPILAKAPIWRIVLRTVRSDTPKCAARSAGVV